MIKGTGPKKKYIKILERYRQELVAANNMLTPERLKVVKRKVNKYIKLLGYEGKEITPIS